MKATAIQCTMHDKYCTSMWWVETQRHPNSRNINMLQIAYLLTLSFGSKIFSYLSVFFCWKEHIRRLKSPWSLRRFLVFHLSFLSHFCSRFDRNMLINLSTLIWVFLVHSTRTERIGEDFRFVRRKSSLWYKYITEYEMARVMEQQTAQIENKSDLLGRCIGPWEQCKLSKSEQWTYRYQYNTRMWKTQLWQWLDWESQSRI